MQTRSQYLKAQQNFSAACKCKYSEVEYFIGQFLDYKCVNFKKAYGSLLKDIFYLPALLYTQL